jgi:hypothetical protein
LLRILCPDMPWNTEVRASWARHERLAASPATVALMLPLLTDLDVRAVLPTVRANPRPPTHRQPAAPGRPVRS